MLQGSGDEFTSCGIQQKQVLQQEAAGDLLVRDKAETREARGEVEMDCQWESTTCVSVDVKTTKMKRSS